VSRRDVVVMRAWIVAGVFAGCGPSKAAETPMPATPTCAGAAAHMVDAMAAGKDPRPPDETINALIALIRGRCEQDRWTPEAVACLNAMASAADADRCSTLLTEDQQAALVRDQDARRSAPLK